MHIYQGPLLQLTLDLWNTTTPNKFTYSRMHIYLGQMYPLQITIDVYNTTPPNKFTISRIHI